MYETFYNLRADPFKLSPDHHFCFSHRSFARAQACLAYAFMRAEGFVMVTGSPGTGKTTLIGELTKNLADDNVVTATLVFTHIQADDLLRMVAYSFGVESNLLKKAELLQRLHVMLRKWHSEGRRALLVVDEAQNLSFSAMEELRLLSNIEADGVPLLQIFLLGQPELRELVLSPQMEQVHQRIIGASHIAAMDAGETEAYIRYRLEKVGWQGDPAISKRIYPLIHKYSDGIPRRVNLICSRLFQHGCIEQRHEIGIRDIRECLVELLGENLAVGPALSEFDFEGDDEFEPPPPSTDAHEKTAPDASIAPADSSSPSDVDATQQPGANRAPPEPEPWPQYHSQLLEGVAESSPDTGKGPRGAGARRAVISMVLFAFLIALVLSVSRYGVGTGFGGAWRELGGKLLVSEHKPSQVLPAVAQPEGGTPRSNEMPSGESARPPPVPEENGEAPLQEGEGSIHNGSVAYEDTLVESVPEGDDEPTALLADDEPTVLLVGDEPTALPLDDFQPSAVDIDPVQSIATAQVEDKPAIDSSGVALQDGEPPEQSSPDLRAVGRQSLPDESIESGEEPSSLLPTSDVADVQTRQSNAPVEPPEEQVILPSVKTNYQIDFDFDSMDLTGGAHMILDLAIDKMNMQAGSAAIVRGFSDGTGPKSYRKELSRGRVAAVLAYMNAAGIEGQRLQVVDVEQSVQAAFNPVIDIEPDHTKIQTVEITVAWVERD